MDRKDESIKAADGDSQIEISIKEAEEKRTYVSVTHEAFRDYVWSSCCQGSEAERNAKIQRLISVISPEDRVKLFDFWFNDFLSNAYIINNMLYPLPLKHLFQSPDAVTQVKAIEGLQSWFLDKIENRMSYVLPSEFLIFLKLMCALMPRLKEKNTRLSDDLIKVLYARIEKDIPVSNLDFLLLAKQLSRYIVDEKRDNFISRVFHRGLDEITVDGEVPEKHFERLMLLRDFSADCAFSFQSTGHGLFANGNQEGAADITDLNQVLGGSF